MKKEKLHLSVDTHMLRTNGKSTAAAITDDLIWFLSATKTNNSEGVNKVTLRAEFKSVDESLIHKVKVLVRFHQNIGDNKSSVKKRRYGLTEEEPQTNSLSKSYVLSANDQMNFSESHFSYGADITFQLLDCYPKLPSFEFKDEHLSNFKLIVGDKTFYTGKDILAHNSQTLEKLLYRQSPRGWSVIKSGKELNHVVVENVDPKTFHKFLGMMLGYKVPSIKDKEFLDFIKLSHEFSCPQSLQECEIAYFKMSSFEQKKQRSAAKNRDVVTNILGKLDEKLKKNVELMKPAPENSNLASTSTRSFDKSLNPDGVRFRVNKTPDEKLESQVINIECLYQDASNLWKHTVNFKYPNKLEEEQEVFLTFSASHPTFNIVIPCISYFVMELERSWGTYEVRKHSFEDADFDPLNDARLIVHGILFYVNKQILANASKYFYTKFYSNFEEATTESETYRQMITLQDVEVSDLEEFLHHVYDPRRAVEETVLEKLLELARFYDAPAIRRKCELYMKMATDGKSMRKAKVLKRKCEDELSSIDKKAAKYCCSYETVLYISKTEELDEGTEDVLSDQSANPKSSE